MRSIAKYVRKHLLLFVGVIALILLLDALLYFFAFQDMVRPNQGTSSPGYMTEQTAGQLSYNDGDYSLSSEQQGRLRQHAIWAMLIAENGSVVWQFDLPNEIPQTYSIQDIAVLSRNYLQDYPVFVWGRDDGLLVLGYPKDSYTKLTSNFLPYDSVKNLPWFTFGIFLLDALLLFGAYLLSSRRISKHIDPIIQSISTLSKGQSVQLHVTGELSEIGKSLNQASEILNKKDHARAHWIAGVSHDIRTPLSMIMGYADRLAQSSFADEKTKEQAAIIRRQSVKIKELIEDLNLTSQLEYAMQPMRISEVSPAKLIREMIAEFINSGLDNRYTFDVQIEDTLQSKTIHADAKLLKRALRNLIQNSITHNPDGCTIVVNMNTENDQLYMSVSDNGKGVSADMLKNIVGALKRNNQESDYASSRHGLGLMIVRRIVEAHHGRMTIHSNSGNGFEVKMIFNG
ncbi:alkaline phosphatase synthesis sensor protein PhoR [Ruminiclostridium hungatei]|uniref:histidine kinase n=1 Tax=Ruminiclostridium hungatei TaxID=48256 RepID=A0A1V4SGF0_RUMHU|nr:HAMP domain-containing sensor histidine kinase [Ruminiclostridium hungatei]OPX42555.1 alkaline phosphatase synthesis sensor protein PhoR [Ruminiclostridium hungatei]